MNEACKTKQNHAWKKGLTAIAIAATIGLTGLSTYQSIELDDTIRILEQTTKTLNDTEKKVENQDGIIKDLKQVSTEQQTSIDTLNTNLQQAEAVKAAQQEKINQLEADLKKKIASRAEPSTVPVGNVSGMTAFRSTAYSYGTTTASGTTVQEGRTIAVDPRVIPLGTQVRIICPAYPSVNGVYTAEDTGRVIKGNIIDIYIGGKSRALEFGRRDIYVEILN